MSNGIPKETPCVKELIALLGITVLVGVAVFLAAVADVKDTILGPASLSILLLIGVLFYRRSRRSAPEVRPACHVAAAIALLIGAGSLIAGLGHSAGVASLALSERVYGPVQILRFTTGAMIVYAGAMSLAMYPGIKAGRRWAVGVGAATSLLFCLYLLFLLPLPGGRRVAAFLIGWSIYLLSLGAAALASRRADGAVRLSLDAPA